MKWSFRRRSVKDTLYKKSKGREWLDAILFAVVAATLIRGLLFTAYAISSGSMEGTQLVGDYLFVSKIAYGSRISNHANTHILLKLNGNPVILPCQYIQVSIWNSFELADQNVRTGLAFRCINLRSPIAALLEVTLWDHDGDGRS